MEIEGFIVYTLFMAQQIPLVIGHRGAAALLPENTMPSFRLATQKFRVPMIEFDVHTTREGVTVIFHDARLERTTNGHGYVSQITLKELKKLDAGYHFDPDENRKFPERGKGLEIPTLEEVLNSFKDTGFAIEIKEKSAELTRTVAQMAKKCGVIDRSIIGSKHSIVSEVMRKQFPDCRRFCSQRDILRMIFEFRTKKQKPARDPQAVASIPVCGIGFRFDTVPWIDFIHAKGMKVFFWTVNDAVEMKSLQVKGADGIITDNAGLLNQVLED